MERYVIYLGGAPTKWGDGTPKDEHQVADVRIGDVKDGKAFMEVATRKIQTAPGTFRAMVGQYVAYDVDTKRTYNKEKKEWVEKTVFLNLRLAPNPLPDQPGKKAS